MKIRNRTVENLNPLLRAACAHEAYFVDAILPILTANAWGAGLKVLEPIFMEHSPGPLAADLNRYDVSDKFLFTVRLAPRNKSFKLVPKLRTKDGYSPSHVERASQRAENKAKKLKLELSHGIAGPSVQFHLPFTELYSRLGVDPVIALSVFVNLNKADPQMGEGVSE